MADKSYYLNLILPKGSKFWNYDTWNTNMNILDEKYLDIKERKDFSLKASEITYSNTKSKLSAEDVQNAIDEVNIKSTGNPKDSITFIDVNSDLVLPVENEAHTYYVLSFGATVHNITFQKTDSSEGVIIYQNGEPTFKPNKTYELSFLYLNCLWGERS